jgi:hypothetical protein
MEGHVVPLPKETIFCSIKQRHNDTAYQDTRGLRWLVRHLDACEVTIPYAFVGRLKGHPNIVWEVLMDSLVDYRD